MRSLCKLALLGTCFAVALSVAETEAAIPISSWGTVIANSDTTYVLTGDLVEPAATQGVDGTVAIYVLPSVHNVEIDGQGFGIDGRDATGTPDADIGIRIVGLVTGPVRDLHIHDVDFTDVDTGVMGTDDLCTVTIENCQFSGCNGTAQISFATTIPGAAMRWITIRDNWLHDSRGIPIQFTNAGNLGSAQQATMEHLYIVGNVIHDNRQALTQPAAWNAAIACSHGAADLRVWDNVVLSNSGLSGLFLGSDDIADDVFDQVAVRGNHFGGNTGIVQAPGTTTAAGITLDRVTTGTADFSTWEVTGNYIYLNELAGIDFTVGSNSPPALPTIGNWWGEDGVVTGTYGNGAVNATDSAPLDMADGIRALPDAGSLDRALSDTDGYLAQVLVLNQNNGLPGIRGFDVDYDFAGSLLLERGVEGPFLARQATMTQFYDIPRVGGSGNQRTASGVILGGSSGAIGNGALCFTVFRAGAEDLAATDDFIQDAAQLRDPDNYPVPVLATYNADLPIDDTDPSAGVFPPGNWPCTNADTVLVEVLVSDNHALEDVLIRYHNVACCNQGCWTPLSLDENGTDYTGPPMVPIDVSGCEGEYIVEIMVTDDAGNRVLAQTTILHDTTPPPDFDGVLTTTTSQGHGTPFQEEVEVSWSGTFELGGDLKLGLLPYGGETGYFAYPEYDDDPGANPHWPEPGEGTVVDLPDIGTGSFLLPFQVTDRSYYYFTIFVEDCATNSSPGIAPGNRSSALSYYLGDFDSNLPPVCAGSPEFDSGSGTVDFCDMIGFSLAYATIEGDPDYHPEADIGPVVPGPGPLDGIPQTDDTINFDDLMIIAINYGTVSPFTGNLPLMSDTGDIGQHSLPLALELGPISSQGSLLTVPLLLRGNIDTVKGLEGIITHDTATLEFLGAEPPAGGGEEIFFAAVPGVAGATSVALAVLGPERVLAGSGVVATLQYRRVDNAPAGLDLSALQLAAVKIRDAGNHEVAGQIVGGASAGVTQSTPTTVTLVNRLQQPVPNPFNPSTTIPFSLAHAGPLTIRVYDAGGRVVRELWNGITPAGARSVTWDGHTENGSPVPSGLYFAEMHAGHFRTVQKLVLLK